MKNLTLVLTYLIAFGVSAQQPEQIYPFSRGEKSITYYKEQSNLWKRETDKDRTNVNAWYNYYYANRNLVFCDTTRTSVVKQAVIKQVLNDMAAAIPESYEYNICRWMSGNWDMKLLPYLDKASRLGPDRKEHLDYSIVMAEMKDDMEARDKWSRRKYDAGMFSNGIIYYNYNVLAGLPENAILLTSGDNDTYPIWYLQSMGIRKDVTVMHTVMLQLPEYKTAVSKRLKIENAELDEENSKTRPGG
jgi:hypothetical protein